MKHVPGVHLYVTCADPRPPLQDTAQQLYAHMLIVLCTCTCIAFINSKYKYDNHVAGSALNFYAKRNKSADRQQYVTNSTLYDYDFVQQTALRFLRPICDAKQLHISVDRPLAPHAPTVPPY